MIAPARRALWRGRATVLIGIVLLALNLRTAVSALSPIASHIREDVAVDAVGLGIIGTLAPVAFAAAGLVAPRVARRVGLEATIVLACLAMVAGPIIRALASDYAVLAVGTAVALAGMGFANILLPAAVKEYFPDRIGTVTALYASLLAIGATTPAVIASPVADAAGWRASLGLWAVVAAVALVPWLLLVVRQRRSTRNDELDEELPEPPPHLLGSLWRSITAWAIALTIGVTVFGAYAMFAWLPQLLVERAGVDATQAGVLLGVFAVMGLPGSLLGPAIAARVTNVAPVIWTGLGCFVVGYLGLLLVPTTLTVVWVALVGLGPVSFPLALALMGLRTKTPSAAAALSGFTQAVGYSVGALGPLVVGLVHDASGDWTVPLIVLLAATLPACFCAVVLAKPRFVEDELASQTSER
ncbi:CP family cyanate transporter-like MFS transporter [Microbacteriaceae bacterium SG_E_30_P1]|uniref:CP family cyanate transporter-like MFS transporter n=1 Tax=Antiquaquibacter oligotrophicus TaxID=2880260 RepID=A0ABT6KLM8_9MICO|nr:MFS transporter [Antiquaquibacter oligotrophicus]MDH6180610.1 CP family cyanate transporter-like MFS transporter [Antiquaquibacter oligotrophicus]UDF13657.1 MFS transporter [Antiquaquibacter oligotrophicus]